MGYLVFNYKKCGEQSSNCDAMKECLRENFDWDGKDYSFFNNKIYPIYYDDKKYNEANGTYGMICINRDKCISCESKYCCKACSCFMLKDSISEMIDAEYEIENEHYDPLFMRKDRFGAVAVKESNILYSLTEVEEKLKCFKVPFILEVYNYDFQCSHFDSVEIETLIGTSIYKNRFFKFSPKIIKENGQIKKNEIKELYKLIGYSFELPTLLFVLKKEPQIPRMIKSISGIYKNYEIERVNLLKSKISKILMDGDFYG